MAHSTTPFKTLVHNELQRLQTLMAVPTSGGHYAVSSYRYTKTNRSATLMKRKPSMYTGLLSFTRVLRFFLF